jgi:hypothetical protein
MTNTSFGIIEVDEAGAVRARMPALFFDRKPVRAARV